jgi:hypothetical protein
MRKIGIIAVLSLMALASRLYRHSRLVARTSSRTPRPLPARGTSWLSTSRKRDPRRVSRDRNG